MPSIAEIPISPSQRLFEWFAHQHTTPWAGSLEQPKVVKMLRDAYSKLLSFDALGGSTAPVVIERARKQEGSYQAYFYDNQLFYLSWKIDQFFLTTADPVLEALVTSLRFEKEGLRKVAVHDWLGNQAILKKRGEHYFLKVLFKYTKAYYLMKALC
jgi:hypothetical protein